MAVKILKECGCVFGEMCRAECFAAANAKIRRGRRLRTRTWPLHSEAVACHPDDNRKFEEEARRRGVPTERDEYGRAIFTSQRHEQRFNRAFGFFNKDSVFSPRNK